jgi:hypothetical protein
MRAKLKQHPNPDGHIPFTGFSYIIFLLGLDFWVYF